MTNFSIKIYPDPGRQAHNNLCYVYLVTELDGITDSVTKIYDKEFH